MHTSWLRDALPYLVLDHLDGVASPDHGAFFRDRLDGLLTQASQARATPLEPVPAVARPLSSYQGVYRHPAYGDVTVELRDDALTWTNRGVRDGRLLPVRDGDFVASAWLFGGPTQMQARFDEDLLLQVEPTLAPLRFARD